MIGWWCARLAVEREPRLAGPLTYLRPQDQAEAEADDGDALVASFAMMHGLELDELDEGEP